MATKTSGLQTMFNGCALKIHLSNARLVWALGLFDWKPDNKEEDSMLSFIEADLELMRLQVAERLGWRSIEYSREGYLIGYPVGRKLFAVVPSYVRDIKAAWILVEYLALYGIRTRLEAVCAGAKRAIIAELDYSGKSLARVETPTAPMAICQAFLNIPGEKLACPFSNSRL